MASTDKIFVSPGVFTSEKDLTFVTRQVGVTTLGLVGETPKGPAEEPVFVSNYNDFISYFPDGLPSSSQVRCADILSVHSCAHATLPAVPSSGNVLLQHRQKLFLLLPMIFDGSMSILIFIKVSYILSAIHSPFWFG